MKIYVVFRQGVFRHECGGIFSSLDAAEACAQQLIASEDDDYHRYEVVPFVLDEVTAQFPPYPERRLPRAILLEEQKPISVFLREGQVVRRHQP